MTRLLRRLSRRTRPDARSDGFTLIELLVVIIIIGILAGIAIPVYLNQRNKAYNTDAKALLRKARQVEVTTLADGATTYSNNVAQLTSLEPRTTWVDSVFYYTPVSALNTVYVETMASDPTQSFNLLLGVRSRSNTCYYLLEVNGDTTYASSTGCNDPYEFWQSNRSAFS